MREPDFDRYITSGQYSCQRVVFRCPSCDESTPGTIEKEYGGCWWEPNECSNCHKEFPDDTPYEDDEPPEPDYDDNRYEEDNYQEDDWRL